MFSEQINYIIGKCVNELGFSLIETNFLKTKEIRKKSKLEIFAEPFENRSMTIKDCEVISRKITKILDHSYPELNDVIIEVSSPGIDRKLANIEDYKKFMGYFVKLKLKKPIERKTNIVGKLVEIINSKKILIEIKEVLIEIELENIEKGKLDINQFFN